VCVCGGARGPVEAGRQDNVDEYHGVHVPLEITTIARGLSCLIDPWGHVPSYRPDIVAWEERREE